MNKYYYYMARYGGRGEHVAGVFTFFGEFDFSEAVTLLEKSGFERPGFHLVNEISEEQYNKYVRTHRP